MGGEPKDGKYDHDCAVTSRNESRRNEKKREGSRASLGIYQHFILEIERINEVNTKRIAE